MINNPNVLWADDEIDLLKPHILFLTSKGYNVDTATNGNEAISKTLTKHYDIVLLDENMPGGNGLEALVKIKQLHPTLPVVMITKNEEEHIMEDAIGSKIADYLIKPVNPAQILLTLKKNLESTRIVSEKTTQNYQKEFMQIGSTLSDKLDLSQWKEIYKKLTYWEMSLAETEENGMEEILQTQKDDANRSFCKYVKENYLGFLSQTGNDGPVLSHNLMRRLVIPEIELEKEKEPVFFVLIDNLRYDQWKTLEPIISSKFRVEKDDLYLSILPTTTQYCRNSIFSGLLPSDIEKRFPNKWSNDEDEGGKNLYEEDFAIDLLARLRVNAKLSYHKITNLEKGKDLAQNIHNLYSNDLNIIVYNFVDSFSHARTDSRFVRELAEGESAYRSITASWFEHSPLWEALQTIAEKGGKVIITTDHGSVKVKNAIKIVGDKNMTTNLRYKTAKQMSYELKDVMEAAKPANFYLPTQHLTSRFVFATEYDFFAYPNNFNHYVNYYKNTLQHGGVSLEEMLCPFIILSSK